MAKTRDPGPSPRRGVRRPEAIRPYVRKMFRIPGPTPDLISMPIGDPLLDERLGRSQVGDLSLIEVKREDPGGAGA